MVVCLGVCHTYDSSDVNMAFDYICPEYNCICPNYDWISPKYD